LIVVSGEARSGTSMMMLIIKRLGFKIAGAKTFEESVPGFNPSGIWEVWGTPNTGLTKVVDADVIKIMTKGLVQSDPALITKIVYCIRDPREVIVSQRGQRGYKNDEHNWDAYLVNMANLFDNVSSTDWNQIHVVDYADMMKAPTIVVGSLALFLGVPPTTEAVLTPDPKYYRSKKHKIPDNEYARAYYQKLRTKRG
jgi:hypothetical protein